MRTRLFAIAAGLLAVGAGACNFDITNTNQPTLDDLLSNPTRTKLAAAATGVIAGARGGIQALIWRLGSTGREGINLSGNNQPDFVEPYFGPVAAGGSFGGTLWFDRYQHIRSINVYLAALGNAKDAAVDPVQGLSTQEKAGARAVANSLKALALLYVVETRGELGAPVDVDRPLNAAPAPFVSEDSAYGYIVGLLNGAATDLTTAGATAFPFPVPPGLGGFDKPATFLTFNRALAAKANVLRATAKNGCGGTKATCYAAALTALGASFINPGATTPTGFQAGVYFDFSTAQGDATNSLSSPLNEFTFYALQGNETDAQLQTGGAKDQRVLDKIAAATDTQRALLGSIPIPGELKFVMYFSGGQADPGHAIPIIKNEELILLRSEANWFGGSKAQAILDLNQVRTNSGKLPATTVTAVSADSVFVKALMYERRYSLLWEQGARWIDARRFGRLGDIPPAIPGGNVPPYMPVPQSECDARNLKTPPASQDVVTCNPPTS